MKPLLTLLACLAATLAALAAPSTLSPLSSKKLSNVVAYRLTRENGLTDNNIRYIEQRADGQLLLMGLHAAYSYDGYTFRRLPEADFLLLKERSQQHHSLEHTGTDNLGNPVAIEGTDLLYTDRKSGQQLRLTIIDHQWAKLTSNLKCRVVTDRKGLVWIALNGFGLYVYEPATGSLRHITKDDGSQLIDTNYLVYMMLDRDDNIWISEEHYGLVCLKTTEQHYELIRPGGAGQGERSNEIRMMRRIADGSIVVANNAGLIMTADGLLQHLSPLPATGENFIAAATDTLGLLWLGSRVDGILAGSKRLAKGRIDCILRDRHGRMWACGPQIGVVCFLSDNRQQRVMQELGEIHPHTMLEDHRGDIWIGANEGLLVFSPDELLRRPQAWQRACEDDVRTIFEDSRHTLWAGTTTHGLLTADNSKRRATAFSRIDSHEGLASDGVQLIIEDVQGNICIGTTDGFTLYTPSTKRLYSQYFQGEIRRNYYEENSAVRLDDGRVAVGTLDGIVVLDASQPAASPAVPHSPVLTALHVNGAALADSLLADGLSLDHGQNSLTFYFSSFNYTNRQQTDYTCLLEGYDKQWSAATKLNFAAYKNLPPGHYTLHVRCRDTEGGWSQTDYTFAVTIRPPLWATWWAYLIYTILAVIAGYTLYRHLRYLFRLRQSIAVEKQVTEYKLKFFTNISHEFRTPLTLIQGSMDKLRQLPETPASARQPLSNMQRNVDRMLRLINQLLEFRRMQNNKLSLSLEETDVVSFCYNIGQSFHDTAERQHIAFSFVPTVKSYVTYIDRGFIDKAVYNLLSNAFKYTPRGGSITLRVAPEGERLLLQVTDTGVGVPEEQRELIFNRFARGQNSRDSLGIGLDLTAELIRTHHGTIRCDANPAGGSIFTITLPTDSTVYQPHDFLADHAVQQQGQTQERQGFTETVAAPVGEPMNDHRVLVAEDDTDIANYLQQELGRYFTVETAADGQQAWQRLNEDEGAWHLLITDVMMPGMNGYELLRRLRQSDRLKQLPVVMLTALDGEEQQVRGLHAGADAYLTKPFSLQLLLLQCRNLLQRTGHRAADTKQKRQAAPDIVMEEQDHKFIAQLSMWVDSHLSASDLSVDKFAADMDYGRTTFYTKLKKLTGQTPNEYIKERRLLRAAELLSDDRITVSEVAYQVGMGTPQYLSSCFKKRFGVTPSQFQKGQRVAE